jgi:hypothetical protein
MVALKVGEQPYRGQGFSADTSAVLLRSNSAILNPSFRTISEIKLPRLEWPFGRNLAGIAEGKMTGAGGYDMVPLSLPAITALNQQGYLRKVASYGYTS